jgi:hypothetical protein
MTVILGPVASIEKADQIADSIKDRLLELFSLTIGCSVGITRRIGYNLVPRLGEGGCFHLIGPQRRIHFRSHSEPRQITDEDIRNLQYAFTCVSTAAESSTTRLFRTALNIGDVVARFLMFYLILYLLRSSQREIDELIKRIKPDVEQAPDPRNPNLMETCYTRWRNESTHRDVDHEVTIQEISWRVHDLTDIVRTAIRQEYHSKTL